MNDPDHQGTHVHDPFAEYSFEALLAAVIERARRLRDGSQDSELARRIEGRSAALTVTHLETAALWHCNGRAQMHLGDNALTDWLLEI